ncbi:hypothetical protein HDU67_006421 [Dinochytrium kinnereticum]|nr:hypothetical protein HDU67_006421 [Dinochytrium kinnereticum]
MAKQWPILKYSRLNQGDAQTGGKEGWVFLEKKDMLAEIKFTCGDVAEMQVVVRNPHEIVLERIDLRSESVSVLRKDTTLGVRYTFAEGVKRRFQLKFMFAIDCSECMRMFTQFCPGKTLMDDDGAQASQSHQIHLPMPSQFLSPSLPIANNSLPTPPIPKSQASNLHTFEASTSPSTSTKRKIDDAQHPYSRQADAKAVVPNFDSINPQSTIDLDGMEEADRILLFRHIMRQPRFQSVLKIAEVLLAEKGDFMDFQSSLKGAKKLYSAPVVRSSGKQELSRFRNSTATKKAVDVKRPSISRKPADHTLTIHYPTNLEISEKWREKLHLEELGFFCRNVNNITQELSRLLEFADNESHQYLEFFCDYAGATLTYLNSVSIPADDLVIGLKSLIDLKDVREEQLKLLLNELEEMEEEISLFKEVIARLPHGGDESNNIIEVVIKQSIKSTFRKLSVVFI